MILVDPALRHRETKGTYALPCGRSIRDVPKDAIVTVVDMVQPEGRLIDRRAERAAHSRGQSCV